MKKIIKKFLSIFCILTFVVVLASCQTTQEIKCPGCGKLEVVHEKCETCGKYKCVGDHSHLPDVDNVSIKLEIDNNVLYKGQSANLTVEISGSENKGYTYSASRSELVAFEGDKVTIVGEVSVDTNVTVTAISNANNRATSSVNITIKAPIHKGEVGDLTSDMLAEIANENITVTGILTDVYQDLRQSANSATNMYEMIVKMDKDAWYGSWNIKGDKEHVITDNYRKGSVDGLKDQYGHVGHALEKLYIDKNNQVARAVVKDYISMPSIWEYQHLWNHISNLNIAKFEFDENINAYKYNIDENNLDDLNLMTYLSYSLTPMLEDTLLSLYVIVEDNHISEIIGQTEVIVSGDPKDPDAVSYTTISVKFSNIGTTVVEDPTPYNAPMYADKLEAALEKMQSLKNYTFRVRDVLTQQPGTGDDYTIESILGNTLSNKALKVVNNTSSVGTEGRLGQVTEEAVLFADTFKYTATMDGKPYRTEYTGLKQNNNGTYDEFAYNADSTTLVGTKIVNGNIFDQLPKFDFSANVFTFEGMSVTTTGKQTYTYVLTNNAITRDIAMEACSYKYSSSAYASTTVSLKITVDEDGNLVSLTFPYEINEGTWVGYCTVTYSKFNETVLDEDLFDGYIARELRTSWSQYTTKYYSPSFSTQDSHEENTDVVLNAVFGSAVKDMPSPVVLMNVLGDNINGPFYDWKKVGTDASGNAINHGYVSITVPTDNYDENSQIVGYHELMAKLEAELAKEGFKISAANSDTTGGDSGRQNRYVCFIKGDIQIVVENNFSRYLWIYFYKTGDWTLKR